MKSLFRAGLFSVGLVCCYAVAADPAPQVSLGEIRRLILAVALVDYPIEQDKIRNAVGIPEGVKLSHGAGGFEGDKRGMHYFWPLLTNADGSEYALRNTFSEDTMKTTGRYPLITSMEVVYFSPAAGHFVADPNADPLLRVPRLKVLMKRDGLTPREFTVLKVLAKYYDEMNADMGAELSALHRRKMATQAPEPTPAAPSSP